MGLAAAAAAVVELALVGGSDAARAPEGARAGQAPIRVRPPLLPPHLLRPPPDQPPVTA